MTAPAIAGVAQIPFFVAALFVSDLWLALVLFCIPGVLTALWFGPVFAVVVGLVRPRIRASCGACLQLIINIIGLGLGPLCVGLFKQRARERHERRWRITQDVDGDLQFGGRLCGHQLHLGKTLFAR